MANQTVTADTITVHGRGSLEIDYDVKDETGAPINISDWVLFFEVDGVPVREQLVPKEDDPYVQVIRLENAQVATLQKVPTRFVVRDETRIDADLPIVLWEGKISRTGYIGEPDAVDDK